MRRGVHADLFVAPTEVKLPDGIEEYGTFVSNRRSKPIKAGTCLGFYRGTFRRRRSWNPYGGARGTHAIETDDFFIVPPPAAANKPRSVDLVEYPLAGIMEVPVRAPGGE